VDSDYARKADGWYCNVFVAAFGGGDGGTERWDCFCVIAGEFPALEDLASYDGFVISGSPHDAHGEEPSVRRLCALVRALHAMRKRVLGVYFGHQVLCRELGGRVSRARGWWDVGVRTVTFARDLQGRLGFLGEFPRSAAIVEFHRDEVWEAPPWATVLASSGRTRVEAFAVGKHALGIQATRSIPPTSSTTSSTASPPRTTSRGASARRRAGWRRRPAALTARSGRGSARASSGAAE
jgi:glucosinolate gamma-glutamyl hydrolase